MFPRWARQWSCGVPGVLAIVLTIAGAALAGEVPNAADQVRKLQTLYGPSSQEGFGSAVFHETLRPDASLTAAALAKYRYFVGENWNRFGERAWMAPWREVYSRPAGGRRDFIAELQAIKDPDARRSTPLLLEATEDPAAAREALIAVYDDATVTELRVFNVGDGAAMSGLLVAARRAYSSDAIYVIALMD